MKAYTDLEQSKKLADILPIESADMFIADVFLKEEQRHSYNFHFLTTWGHKNFDELKERENKFVQFIPCWSLAALLDVLPEINGVPITLEKVKAKDGYEGYYYHIEYKNIVLIPYSKNPTDACYEMIIKLHKQKLL